MGSDNWITVRLKEEIEIEHGYAFKGEYFCDKETDAILLTPGNFKIGGGIKLDKLKYYDGPIPDEYILQEGDLLISMTDLSKNGDTLGYPAIIPKDISGMKYLHNQRLGKVVMKEGSKLDKGFLYWIFRSQPYRDEVLASATGTTVRHTAPKRILSYPVSAPPIPEQQKIASILSALDDKIELNNEMNKTLEEMAQALFEFWFVDFEPFQNGEFEYHDELQREIPKGWVVKRIGDVCKTFGGGTPKTTEPTYWNDGDIYWATPTDITALNSHVIFDTARKITKLGLEKSSAKLLPAGTVLMTSRATLGYFAISKVSISTNQGFISMVCDDYPSNYFMMHAVKDKLDTIIGIAGGSTYPEINKTAFRSIQIILPPKETVSEFDKVVQKLSDQIYENEKETKNLTSIRDVLLPKLLSGEIRVTVNEKREAVT